MNYMIGFLHAFSSVIGLTVNVVSQVLAARYMRQSGLLKSVFIGFASGVCGLLFLEWLCCPGACFFSAENIFSVFASIITYSALGYGYFHFVNLGETARRIRILRELADSENGLSVKEILLRYNAKNMIEARLGRLIRSGQIRYENNSYYIGKPFVLWMAKITAVLKFIILGRKSKSGG
jgi:hypothetical protein